MAPMMAVTVRAWGATFRTAGLGLAMRGRAARRRDGDGGDRERHSEAARDDEKRFEARLVHLECSNRMTATVAGSMPNFSASLRCSLRRSNSLHGTVHRPQKFNLTVDDREHECIASSEVQRPYPDIPSGRDGSGRAARSACGPTHPENRIVPLIKCRPSSRALIL